MKKLYISFLFIFVSLCFFGQSFPYLNASAGNENEFPVDKDTSTYMFHGNRLVKTDKNFNSVWANTYSGLNFLNLLLSKTGSIYFIGGSGQYGSNYNFGKINPNGTLSWVKNTSNINALLVGNNPISYQMDCVRMFLDRNNDLAVTGYSGSSTNGKGFLLKTDTNGNVSKFKAFGPNGSSYFDKFSFLDDSAGYYKIIAGGMPIIGPTNGVAMYVYNDNTDVFTLAKPIYYINIPFGFSWKLVRSKLSKDFYIHTSTQDAFSYVMNGMARLSPSGQLKWQKEFGKMAGTLYAFAEYLEEDNKGNVLLSMTTGPPSSNVTTAFVKADSSGVLAGSLATTMLNAYPFTSFPPRSIARSINAGNYYFESHDFYFPLNPLTIQKFTSTLSYSCSALTGYSLTVPSSGFPFSVSTPTMAPLVSYNIPSSSSTVTPVTFSVNLNFCTVLGINEIDITLKEGLIFPNPSSDKIYFSAEMEKVEIYDVNGKELRCEKNVSNINVADLATGIYFIRIKTDRGEFSKKFIKE